MSASMPRADPARPGSPTTSVNERLGGGSVPASLPTRMNLAELAARRTAAATVGADFETALKSGPLCRPPDMTHWAYRLRDHLVALLDCLDALEAGPVPPKIVGPFEAERQVGELPAVRAVYEAFRADPRPGRMTSGTERLLSEALAEAGVLLGAYDRRVMAWLAGWEPQTVAVVASWVTRAARPTTLPPAGLVGNYDASDDLSALVAALKDAAEWRDLGGGQYCADCDQAPGGVCDQHADDLAAAERYRQLAARLCPRGEQL